MINDDRVTTRLYLITPPALDPHGAAALEAALEAATWPRVQLPD